MAAPRPRRVSYRKSGAFNPLAPAAQTNRGFQKTVNLRAQGLYQPQLNAAESDIRNEQSASSGRIRDLQSMYGFAGDESRRAYQDTVSAINDLIAKRTASSGASQAALAGALRASEGRGNDIGSVVGGAVPSQQAQTLPAAYGGSESGLNYATAAGNAAIAAAAQRQALPGVGLTSSGEAEQRRSRGVLNELNKKRTSIMDMIPTFREQARKEVLGEEVNKQNLGFQQQMAGNEFGLKKQVAGFQQDLANKEFGLKKKQEAFNEWQTSTTLDLEQQKFIHQKGIDWAQIQNQKDQITATGNDKLDAARGKRWDAGLKAMTEYIAPQPGELDKHKNVDQGKYSRDPSQLYSILTGQVRMPGSEALALMGTLKDAETKRWLKQRGFRKRNKGQGGGAKKGNPTGRNVGERPG